MKRAFTLIELLIVIAIIAILALIAVPNFLEAQVRAKTARVHADMRSIATAIEAYAVDWGAYPRASMESNFTTRWFHNFLYFTGGPQAYMVKSLTTPVAYFGGNFPADPFTVKGALIDQSATGAFRNARNCSYWYINISGAAQFAKANPSVWIGASNVHAPAPLSYNGPRSKTYSSNWALYSAGPDRSAKVPRVGDPSKIDDYRLMLSNNAIWNRATGVNPGYAPLYDPSNGTMSMGDIWRLSAGSPH